MCCNYFLSVHDTRTSRSLFIVALVSACTALDHESLLSSLSCIVSYILLGSLDKCTVVDTVDYTLFYLYIYLSKRPLIHLGGSSTSPGF